MSDSKIPPHKSFGEVSKSGKIFTFTHESQHLTQLRISLCPHRIMSNSPTGKQHMMGLRAQDHSGNKDQGPVVGTQRWDSGNSFLRL